MTNTLEFQVRVSLPNQNAFVTLSNTRLVSANGEEATCETTPGNFIAPVEVSLTRHAPKKSLPLLTTYPVSRTSGPPASHS